MNQKVTAPTEAVCWQAGWKKLRSYADNSGASNYVKIVLAGLPSREQPLGMLLGGRSKSFLCYAYYGNETLSL